MEVRPPHKESNPQVSENSRRGVANCPPHFLNTHQTCVRCGLVVGLELCGQAPKRRSINRDKITTVDLSTGINPRYPDYGIGTKRILLTLKNKEMTAGEIRRVLHRGEKWGSSSRDWGERKLRQTLIELDKMAEKLVLPKSVQGEIAYLYRKCRRANLTVGHETRLLIGALIYAVCRRRHISRTLTEICEAIGYNDGAKLTNSSKVAREVRRLTKALKMKFPPTSNFKLAKEYLPRFATKLGLGDEAVRCGFAVLNNNGHGHKGSPTVLAGAVLYGLERHKGIGIRVVSEKLNISTRKLSQTANILNFSPL